MNERPQSPSLRIEVGHATHAAELELEFEVELSAAGRIGGDWLAEER
jgi:hypothetical protein